MNFEYYKKPQLVAVVVPAVDTTLAATMLVAATILVAIQW